MTSRLRLVLGNATLAKYPQGGGHWMVRVQYLRGLRALGHDVHLLALLDSTGSSEKDQALIDAFFARWRDLDLGDQVAVLLFADDGAPPELKNATIHGKSRHEIEEIIASADLLWNDCSAILQPMLSSFARSVLIDLDPGLLQTSIAFKQQHAPHTLTWERDLFDHDAFLTLGGNVGNPNCPVPTLGLPWRRFTPFAYLPMWPVHPDPGAGAPFTSVTHWNWGGEVTWNGRRLSFSKRDAYLRYLDLPTRSGRPFELAANILHDDGTGDETLLAAHGWRHIDPWHAAATPQAYQRYIAASRAEISCPKPIYREMRTGWLSDRSVCYLASGRPVLAEDTGLESHLPIGQGVLTFSTMDEAVAGVREIDGDYARHSRAAREIAEAYLDSRRCLQSMIEASFASVVSA